MLQTTNFNANVKTLQISIPPMEQGVYSCTIVDNLTAKVVTKKSDNTQLQIIEVPCEYEGKKFKASLLTENAQVFAAIKSIGDIVSVAIDKNAQGYKTATI